MSPYKYIRQDLDNPKMGLQSAKKSLKFKLDEVARSEYAIKVLNFQTSKYDYNYSIFFFLLIDYSVEKCTKRCRKNVDSEDPDQAVRAA